MIDSSSTYVALIAGLLSFFSPCIFPLFPIYLTTLGLDGKIINKTNRIWRGKLKPSHWSFNPYTSILRGKKNIITTPIKIPNNGNRS